MRDFYCPECQSACGTDACPTTAEGVCERCGKLPVAFEDRAKPWVWCRLHARWHDTPCAEDVKRHCCSAAA